MTISQYSNLITILVLCKEISNTLVKVGNLIERYAKEGSLREVPCMPDLALRILILNRSGRVIWANDWKARNLPHHTLDVPLTTPCNSNKSKTVAMNATETSSPSDTGSRSSLP